MNGTEISDSLERANAVQVLVQEEQQHNNYQKETLSKLKNSRKYFNENNVNLFEKLMAMNETYVCFGNQLLAKMMIELDKKETSWIINYINFIEENFKSYFECWIGKNSGKSVKEELTDLIQSSNLQFELNDLLERFDRPFQRLIEYRFSLRRLVIIAVIIENIVQKSKYCRVWYFSPSDKEII